MGLRKFRADKFFDGYSFCENNPVLITDEQGLIIKITDEESAGDDVEYLEGILSPGFINCHCHLELSHLKGQIPEGTGLVDFLASVMNQRYFPIEEILDAIVKTENEMLIKGIVAVGDICNTAHSVLQKKSRKIFYHNFIEVSGVNDDVAEKRFMQALSVYEEFAKISNLPSASNSMVPHSPYSVSEKLWSQLVSFPGNQLFSFHNQETPAENEWFEKKEGIFHELFHKLKINISHFIATGKSSLQTVLPRFLPNQDILLVHNVATTREDIMFAEQYGNVHWCICINANKYITGLIPPVELFRKHDCNIVLGTDSLASNHSLNILDEIKTIRDSFPLIPLGEILRWATSNGAKALNISDRYGSFERGKSPGIIAIKETNEVTVVQFDN